MLRQGKSQGWLTLPPEAFNPWAQLNGVKFHDVKPGRIAGRGSALIASKAVTNSAEGAECLLTVPRDLILGQEQILEQAKVDRDFRELLESVGDFGRTPRGAILCFLLFQASIACPDLPERLGVHGPFSDYVKSLPLELLPTFWTPSELQLLVGTTLAPATASKLRSLRREWDLVCESAEHIRWYRLIGSRMDFDDWLQVDAMYRSRALDYPQIGHCMVPCVDLANHTPHEGTIAIYEKDAAGNAVLVLRDGKSLVEGDEVTISYGDEKGACEMLFSYGFLDEGMETAETLFLSLVLPESDVMRAAKMEAAGCAPGFKLIDAGDGEVDWKGEFVWLLCVGEEDGLHFDVARTVDGEEEIHGFFKEHELTDGAAELYRLLGQSEMYDVYRLRAVIILQQRVFDQMQVLYASQDDMEAVEHGDDTGVRQHVYDQAMKLRRLEFELMERAYEDFEKQKIELSESDVVKRYLASMQETTSTSEHQGEGDEDFS